MVLAYALAANSVQIRADVLSNNTVKVLSDNNIQVRDNVFYTPVSNTINVALQLSGGPWGAVASSVFGLVTSQMAEDQSNKRFEQINRQLQEIAMKLNVIDAKLDRIELALLQISDKNDEILDAIHAVPARLAYSQVLGDISVIGDSWDTWLKTSRTAVSRKQMENAYERLRFDAAKLSNENDPLYTPALAIALRLNLDLAIKLSRSAGEVNDIKKAYRRFLEAALASGPAIKPGDRVLPTDSFPTRLAKRKALMAMYLGDEYHPTLSFGAICSGTWGDWRAPVGVDYGSYFGNTETKDSFVWDPPADPKVLVQLIRANAANVVVGPEDERLRWSQRSFNIQGDFVEQDTPTAAYWMQGVWDLAASVRVNGNDFEYLGAYYHPKRLDKCLPVAGTNSYPKRLGVLTPGTSIATPFNPAKSTGLPRPTRPEDFFQRYGKIDDPGVTDFAQRRVAQANRQAQLMAYETIAFAAASELREILNRK